jgi:hypothetical protein
MRSASLVLLLCPHVALAEAPPPPPPPPLALMYSSLTVLRVNPLGLQEQAEIGLQARMWTSDSLLLRDTFAGLYFSPLLTPGFLAPAVTLKVQPLALLRLEAKYSWVKYLGTFNLLQSYESPAAVYSDTAIKDRGDQSYAADGVSLALTAELRGKVGPVVARSRFSATFHDMELRAGDRVWYDQFFDLLVPGTGWTLTNDLDVLWQLPIDATKGSMFMAGARYSVAAPIYGPQHYAPGQAQEHDNGPFHRVGPMFVYTFFDEPGAAFNKPSLIAIVNWHLVHRWRTGEDSSAAFPYLVVGFAFTGELVRLVTD